MTKCRVFKRINGHVIYSWPHERYQEIENFEGCKFPPEAEGLPFVDLLESELPDETGRDWFYHGPLMMDGDCCKENLKFDEKWEHFVMPSMTIKRKLMNKIIKDIDEELAKEKPDQMKLFNLDQEARKLDKKESCPYYHELKKEVHCEDSFWLSKAIEGLDARCTKGESDKPKVREKIMALLKKS